MKSKVKSQSVQIKYKSITHERHLYLHPEGDVLEVDDGAVVLLQVPADLHKRQVVVLVPQLWHVLQRLQDHTEPFIYKMMAQAPAQATNVVCSRVPHIVKKPSQASGNDWVV